MFEARDMDTRVRRTNRKWRGYLSQGANRENSSPSRITVDRCHELCYNKSDGQLSSHVSLLWRANEEGGRQRPTWIRNDTAHFISILFFFLPSIFCLPFFFARTEIHHFIKLPAKFWYFCFVMRRVTLIVRFLKSLINDESKKLSKKNKYDEILFLLPLTFSL